ERARHPPREPQDGDLPRAPQGAAGDASVARGPARPAGSRSAPRPLPSLLGPCRADRVADLAWPRSRLPPPSLPEELMKAHQPDPCGQIQADLSAMLDGELDAPSVRRVMIHSDACPNCRAFL